MSKQKVTVPDIGDFEEVPVIEVLVADGDTVEKDQALIVLESDKATMEVPAPAAGKISGLKVKAGDKVSEGSLICQVEAGDSGDDEDAAPKKEKAAKSESKPEPSKKEQPAEKKPDPPKQSAAKKKSAGGSVEAKVPDIGDFESVPVIEVLVADGDTVEKDQALIVLESDKATMEVPAPAAGTVSGLKVKAGDKLSEGDVICKIDGGDGEDGDAPSEDTTAAEDDADREPHKSQADEQAAHTDQKAEKADPAGEESAPSSSLPFKPEAKAGLLPHASPAVRKFARELGVDLTQVQGSADHGRITQEDLQKHVKSALQGGAGKPAAAGGGVPTQPQVDYSKFGEVETKPLSRIRKISLQHLHRNWLLVPHVTQQDEADITELEAFRKAQSQETGQKITLLPFLLKAVGVALKQFPEFNSSLAADGENLVMKKYCHIGFAADTEHGLVVPVVKNVWSKGVVELAEECAALAAKARDGKLKPDDMRGGCFSISSLGGIGGSFFTPIVNAPEVAILGVSRAQMKPVWDGKAFQPRLLCPLSLSYDHRVIDGAYAARFITQLSQLIGDVRRLAL